MDGGQRCFVCAADGDLQRGPDDSPLCPRCTIMDKMSGAEFAGHCRKVRRPWKGGGGERTCSSRPTPCWLLLSQVAAHHAGWLAGESAREPTIYDGYIRHCDKVG